MKKILSYMTVLLLLALAVSCNMDSDTGLFQEAGESVKKESYVINKVIAEDSTSSSSTTEKKAESSQKARVPGRLQKM